MSVDIEKLKSIDIVSYLAKHGIHPKRTTGKTAQYLSPIGEETQASFMVDLARNRFQDYHSSRGGDTIDLVCALNNCSFKEAIRILSDGDCSDVKKYTPPKKQLDGVEIKSVDPLTDGELIDYMTQIRKINYDVLMTYTKEVSFRFPHSKKDPNRIYKAVGFQNDLKGFELRSSWMKVASSPKSFTTIRGESDEIDLWEGWLDFLSHLTFHGRIKPVNKTYVLNGARIIRVLKPFLDGKKVNFYGDADRAGDETLAELDNCTAKDMRHEFLFHNDFNSWLMDN